MESIKRFATDFGLPRIIITLYLFALFLAAPFVGVDLPVSISDTLIRIGMNGIMVLALVPMIQSGCGLNFGLSLGVIAGLLGATISIEMGLVGAAGFLTAIFIFNEPFQPARLLSFGLIWLGLAVFSVSMWRKRSIHQR